MAHVPELIGCFAVGSTREETLERLRRNIAEYLDWLAGHGETPAPTTDSEVVEIEVGEEASVPGSYPLNPGDPVAFFNADGEPFSRYDVQTTVRLIEHARSDLLEFLRDVPDNLLHWRPGTDEWSIAQTLLHMAHAEASYIARLDDESERSPFPQLAAIRSWAYHRLSRLTEAELSRVTTHRGEKWSVRKVLRRFLEHDREHTAHIRSVVARYHRSLPDS
jgi:predicted RNase H-like HicB family nuclease